MSQSKFKSNQAIQLNTNILVTPRLLRKLENGWSGHFNREVVPILIECEDMFAPLYSSKPNSRPSTPTYFVLGALVLKDLFGLTDEELEDRIAFSLDFQYALGTVSLDHQPINQRTLNRFRAANSLYTRETGIDLIAQFMDKIADALKNKYLGTNRKRRMDSVMIDNGCRKLSRLQLAHVINKNALFLLDEHQISIPDELYHYIEDFDENKVTYHSKQSASDKLLNACQDACAIRDLIPSTLQDNEDVLLLKRFISEQVILNPDGSFESVRDGKTLTSTTLNNPAEPDSTIRKKAGETHQGFVGNFAETVDTDTNRKFIDSADFQPNIYSDSQFCKDEIQKMAEAGDTTSLCVDGAYAGIDNVNEAAQHGIKLIGTAMAGKETPDLVADFVIDDDEQTVICPNGKKADRAVYSEKTESYRVSYFKNTTCKGCPFAACGNCPFKEHKRVRSGNISRKMIQRAEIQRTIRSDEFEENYRFRNGVEAIPSQLRRNQKIDNLPYRGFLRKKMGYFLAITAINVRRALRYAQEDAKKVLESIFQLVFTGILVNLDLISQTD